MFDREARTSDDGVTASAFPGAVERRHLDREPSLLRQVVDNDRLHRRVDFDLLTQTR